MNVILEQKFEYAFQLIMMKFWFSSNGTLEPSHEVSRGSTSQLNSLGYGNFLAVPSLGGD